jgi:hypothetical protein
MLTFFTNRQVYRAFNAPPFVGATKRTIIVRDISCPILQVFGDAFNGDIRRVVLISALLLRCCPPHVTALVVTVIIFSVKRMFRTWFSTDLFKEFFKRREPKFNTATPVQMVVTQIWVITSPLCQVVGGVFGRSFSGNRKTFTMCVAALFKFYIVTAAGFGVGVFQVIASNFYDFSAIAATKPKCSAFRSTGVADYFQPVKFLSGQIDKIWMVWNRLKFDVKIFISHIVSYTDNVIRLVRNVQDSVRAISILPRNTANTEVLFN